MLTDILGASFKLRPVKACEGGIVYLGWCVPDCIMWPGSTWCIRFVTNALDQPLYSFYLIVVTIANMLLK